MSSDKCYAAIDLGTNSCRLLICNQDGKELCKETVSTRLGEGMYKNMAFTSEAIERGVKCFYDFSFFITISPFPVYIPDPRRP